VIDYDVFLLPHGCWDLKDDRRVPLGTHRLASPEKSMGPNPWVITIGSEVYQVRALFPTSERPMLGVWTVK
jgi:hypothetical protein